MTGQASEAGVWGLNPDTIQFWFVAVLLAAAAVRQLVAWGSGYCRYGRAKLSLCRAPRTHKPHLPRLSMRCDDHLGRPLHPDEIHDDNPMSYVKNDDDKGLVVRPVAVSTRHWSYDTVEGDRIGRARWIGTCLWLTLHKRFTEPRIDPCHYC